MKIAPRSIIFAAKNQKPPSIFGSLTTNSLGASHYGGVGRTASFETIGTYQDNNDFAASKSTTSLSYVSPVKPQPYSGLGFKNAASLDRGTQDAFKHCVRGQ